MFKIFYFHKLNDRTYAQICVWHVSIFDKNTVFLLVLYFSQCVKEMALEMKTHFILASTVQSGEYEYLQPDNDVKYANTDVAPSPIKENSQV